MEQADVRDQRRLALVLHRSPHHAAASGYARLARYLPGHEITADARVAVPYAIRRRLAALGRERYSSLYDANSVTKEIRVLSDAVRSRGGLVHFFHGERDFFLTRYWARALGWRVVGSVHKPPATLSRLVRGRDVFSHYDGVICVGPNQVPFVREAAGHDRVWFVPHGVDTAFFAPGAEPEVAAQSCHCIFVGQHLRDFETLSAVVAALRSRIPNLTLTAVVGPEYQHLLPAGEFVDVRSGLSDEQLRREYQRASLLLLPLLDSTACNSVLEALSCGLPIVTNDGGGIRGYLNEGSGFMCENGPSGPRLEDMIESAWRLLKEPQLNLGMRAAARSQALGFAWPAVGRRVVRVYRDELGFEPRSCSADAPSIDTRLEHIRKPKMPYTRALVDGGDLVSGLKPPLPSQSGGRAEDALT